jgi:4,5:9,10-diseco-3-hydroxy-5,9,17-trioxoandrosta-1(10),2-diene-4-oate hydrolase
VKSPTLVVWGKQDRIVPLAHGEAYRDAIGDAQLKVIDQCGHAPQLEKPSELAAIVREFIE